MADVDEAGDECSSARRTIFVVEMSGNIVLDLHIHGQKCFGFQMETPIDKTTHQLYGRRANMACTHSTR